MSNIEIKAGDIFNVSEVATQLLPRNNRIVEKHYPLLQAANREGAFYDAGFLKDSGDLYRQASYVVTRLGRVRDPYRHENFVDVAYAIPYLDGKPFTKGLPIKFTPQALEHFEVLGRDSEVEAYAKKIDAMAENFAALGSDVLRNMGIAVEIALQEKIPVAAIKAPIRDASTAPIPEARNDGIGKPAI